MKQLAHLVAVLGVLLAVAGAVALWGPVALIVGGAAVTSYGLVFVDVDA